MEKELINAFVLVEEFLKKKSLDTKSVMDKLYGTEYMSYDNGVLEIIYNLPNKSEDIIERHDLSSLTGAIIPIVKLNKETMVFIKTICAINENNKNLEESIVYYLLKAISTDVKFKKAFYKKRIINSGFVQIIYEAQKDKIKCYEISEYEYINQGVLEYLSEEIYKEIYKKPMNKNKLNLFTTNYLVKEITRILNFVLFETEDYTKLLEIYLKNDIDTFLMDVQLRTGLEEKQLCEIYNVATAFLEGRQVCKSIYIKDDYIISTLKTFIEDMYNIAKENQIPKTEHFFAKELNKDIFSNIF